MAVSREEYLKRYLSGPIQEKKKSKKKASKAVVRKAGLKILDDDIDFKSLLPNNIQNSLDDDLADDNPVVIDLGLDDRPEQIKELERMKNSRRWKVIDQDKDDSENLQQSEPEEEIRKEREAIKKSLEHSNSSSDRRKNEKKRYDSESDTSPARIGDDKAVNRSISPTRKRRMHDSGSAASSVRTAQRERHSKGDDTSIGKRKRQDSTSSSDKSPSRQRQDSTDGSDNYSPKRRRLDSEGSADNSPPRQTQGTKASFKNSSPRRKRKDSADNAEDSPRRRKQGRDPGSDNSPPRRKQGRDPSSDNSPPRRKQGRDPSSDNSPPRRKGKESSGSVNNSHPQQRHNRSTHSNSSPPRRRKDGRADSDLDISPPRKENKSSLRNFQQKQAKDRTDERHDATNSPQVIYRKDGKKRDLQAEKKLKDEEEAEKAALAAKYKEWNKGLKQKEIAHERLADALNEVEKPLARYRDDKDLDSHLRARLHDEDPMLAFMKKKKSTAKGGVEKPRYRGPQPPPNRFSIEPGYRWDGVDRSNGFEKKIFSKRSEDKAVKDMAYKWSVEDM